MASFELSRAGRVADFARASTVGRFLPLYLAGISAGAGIGLALTAILQESDAATPRPLPPAAQGAPARVREFAPTIEAPPAAPAALAEEQPSGTSFIPIPGLPDVILAAPNPPALPVVVSPPAAEPVAPAPVLPAAGVAPVAAPAPAAPETAPPAEEAPPAAAPAPAKPNFYVPEPRAGGITNLEQRLLDGINAERAAAGLPPYSYEAGLASIARVRVQQLVDQNYFGHTDPFGYSMYVELLAHFGYTSYAWAGENLAMNNYSIEESPEKAVAALMRSPTHKANILAGDFFRIGIGELTTPDGRHFYAMIFLG
ncbi:hypothetical protein EDM76_08630 [bacterium]|nr:MAG: hypothetical protein EDM76_08630 [bacterium]MCL4231393.1 hypothetical protein [Dehalococcoidia bacterium]